MQPPGSLLSPSLKSIKKIHPKKISYTPGKVELSNLKKKLPKFQETETPQKIIFSQKKAFLLFRKTETP